MTRNHLRRSRTLKITRQATDDSLSKAVNSIDSGISSLGASTDSKVLIGCSLIAKEKYFITIIFLIIIHGDP